jgi:PAS domain S-box-containing protein
MNSPTALKRSLSYLILGQKGGQKRVEIIDLLKARPYNVNQLAENLNVNYRTARHHIDALLKHELITTSKTGGYGEVYFLTPSMEENVALFENMKKMLNEVTSSPRLFQALLEQTNDAVVILNKDEETIFWNDSAGRLYGYDEEEVMGTKIRIFEDPRLLSKKQKMVLNGKKVVGFETKVKHKSGSVIDALVTIDTIRDKDENLLGFSIIARDIAERKRAEEALRRSEKRYALAQRVANIGSWDWNIETGELKWSDRIEPMFGFKRGMFRKTYEAFLECVHPDDRKFVEDSAVACVEKGKDYAIEHRIVWPDGSVRWVSEMGNVVRDTQKKAVRMLGIVQDVTERKRAEDALRDAKENLELRVRERTRELEMAKNAVEAERKLFIDALDTLPAYLVLLTPDYHVPFANRFFRERFGESHGKRCFEYLFERNEPCEDCKTYDTLEKMAPLEWEWLGPDDRNYHIYDFPFKDTDGSTLIMEVGFDITERKLAEEKLERMNTCNRNLIEISPDPLVTLDPYGRITDLNHAMEDVTGHSRDELIGTDFSRYFTDPERARAACRLAHEEGLVRDYPLDIKHRDGQVLRAHYNATVYRDKAGSVVGLLAVGRSV